MTREFIYISKCKILPSYKSETRICNSQLKIVLDFNFGRQKDLSALKSDIHLDHAASLNITFGKTNDHIDIIEGNNSDG